MANYNKTYGLFALCGLPFWALHACGKTTFPSSEGTPSAKTVSPTVNSNMEATADSRGQLILHWTHSEPATAFAIKRYPNGTRVPENFVRVGTSDKMLSQNGSSWSLAVAAAASKKLAAGDCISISAEASDRIESLASTSACLESVDGKLQFFIDGE